MDKEMQFNLETTAQQERIDVQHEFQQALKPPPWLNHVESPFKWAGTLNRTLTFYGSISKLDDYKNQGAFYGFEKFVILLVIIQKQVLLHTSPKIPSKHKSEADDVGKGSSNEDDRGESDDENEGEGYLYEFEEALDKCVEVIQEMEKEGDVMYCRIGPAFHHVLQSTTAHVLFVQGKIYESQEIAKNIQEVKEMSLECQAGIEGLKTRFIMTMYRDYKVLIPHVYKAIELDPHFGYWHYLTGKVKRRLRRDLKQKMDEEELERFRKAVELEKNPKFLVFLAQAYQEMSLPNLQKSVELYRECWELKKDSAAISRRIGNGMLKMKGQFFDKVMVEEVLLKAAELSPKGSFHALGRFYYFHEKDDEKAVECFKKDRASRNKSSTEMIRLNLIKNPDYDPFDVLQLWLKHDKALFSLKHQLACCDLGWYYLMYKNDLETSVKYYQKVLQMDYQSLHIMEYRSYGFLVDSSVNMVEVLVNEILLLKDKNEMLPVEERKDLMFLEGFLEKVLEKHPNLRNMHRKPQLLDELKTKVNQTIESKRSQRYRANCRRSEPGRSKEHRGSWRTSHRSGGEEENNNREQHRLHNKDINRRFYNRQNSNN